MTRLVGRGLSCLVFALVIGGLVGGAASARADNPWNSWWVWNALGPGYGGSIYSSGKLFVPPYFAVHPPVYYGQRVRMHYGDSPFAASSSRWSSARSGPVVIVNPHMTVGDAGSVADRAGPRIIENPYFQADAN